MRKVWARSAALALLLWLVCAAVPALGETVEADLAYTISSGEATVIGWRGSTRSNVALTIPATLGGCPVTAIADQAFNGAFGSLTSLTLPEGLRSIGMQAFYAVRCYGPVTIPSTVDSIGTYAFAYMYNMPEFRVAQGNSSYTAIDGVLYNSAVTTLLHYPLGKASTILAVPESVTMLYCTSLASSSLKTLLVPSGNVRAMGYTFYNCTMTVYGRPGTILAQGFAGGWWAGNATFQDIAGYDGPTSLRLDKTYIRAEQVLGLTPKTYRLTAAVGPAAQAGQPLTWQSSDEAVATVDAAGRVTLTGGGRSVIRVFAASGLTAECVVEVDALAFEIHLPKALTTVEASALSGCTAVRSVLVPEGATVTLGDRAFAACTQLKRIYLGENVTGFGVDVFAGSPQVIIVCRLGSTAYLYARQNGIKYQLID